MKRFGLLAALIVSMSLAASLSRAADKVNPSFRAWEKFGIGSTETLEGTIESPGGAMTSSTTTKLVEKASDHVVVETSTTVTLNGTPRTIPGKKSTIEADADSGKELKEIGTEKITAAGKTFACKIYTPANPNPDSPITTKLWASYDVPGGIVKMEITGKVKILQTLKSFEIK